MQAPLNALTLSNPQTSRAAEVLVIRTGCANVASILAALRRAGASGRTTECPHEVAAAPAVILPGVGAFGPAMQFLRERGLDTAITQRIADGKPLFCICLGLHLLCEESEESPGIRGLGVLACVVRRLTGSVRIPQIGWNIITPAPPLHPLATAPVLLRSGYAYFANSYCIQTIPDGWVGAKAVHGTTFTAAIERGSILACQFHPELSGRLGTELLSRWLPATTATVEATC